MTNRATSCIPKHNDESGDLMHPQTQAQIGSGPLRTHTPKGEDLAAGCGRREFPTPYTQLEHNQLAMRMVGQHGRHGSACLVALTHTAGRSVLGLLALAVGRRLEAGHGAGVLGVGGVCDG
eukprot:364943-Chlamydomonas_euryale.AAC.39